MHAAQALLILAGLVLWVLAAAGVRATVSLVLVGAVLLVLGWALPVISAGL